MANDRTTVRVTFDELLVKLRANLVAEPTTAASPFRAVVVGGQMPSDLPRPALAVTLDRARPIATVDGDKLTQVALTFRVLADAIAADFHGELLDRVAAVDDYLDSLIDSGVIDGADGFDDRAWTFDEPDAPAGARIARASATQSFVVRVARGQNRVAV